MSDEMVLRAQRFINSYAVPGIPTVEENGRTSWRVMYALTRALQHELGVSPLSDSFGPGTLAALQSRYPVIDRGTKHGNIYRIVQSGLYCKGYDGGDIDGLYNARVSAAVTKLKRNMGVSGVYPGDGITPKLFKALLTMDPYVVVNGASEPVRSVQQWLNARYVDRQNFFISPCDGHFSRGVQKAFLLAIQFELGMADDVANGRFGPGTQAGIKAQAILSTGAADATKQFVHLFQAAMLFNGWHVPFDGRYTAAVAGTVSEFQRFVQLVPATGTADFRTWASLLVSTGDPTRPGTACDCVTEITTTRAQALRAAGYTTVGRYLSNAPGSSLNKKIQPGELDTIVAAGLSVFPIYQTNGGDRDYFSAQQGANDALAALDAANDYGFPRGTTIYFAVDYDAVDEEVTDRVIPHFRTLASRMAHYGGQYRIGVYAPRNICSRLAKAGLTVASFVSDMSTGYSGNLGFPLPRDWAFDQISTITIGADAGRIEIDKDVASGRDRGQSRFLPRPAADKLDVIFDRSKEKALYRALFGYMVDRGLDDLHRLRSSEACVAKLMDLDPLITGLSRAYRMRKALIQTVIFWEYHADVTDPAVDALVAAFYAYMEALEAWQKNPFGPPPQPPLIIRDDSSTGVAQIFARTAIKARNYAAAQGLTADPPLNAGDWHVLRDVWQKLRDDDDYNTSTVPLVLIEGAHEVGVTADRLRYSAEDTRRVLARYNGTGDAAAEYGRRALDLYQIIEAYNLPLRG
jgi:peptidoglycan hydrolase-like protein with peptidoglycan-binding domain